MPKKKTKATAKKLKKPKRKARPSKKRVDAQPKQSLSPVHPWRVCPYGEHWVRTHPMHVPPSKAHPEGSVTTRHEHCARNPSGKDQLYPEEIREIAKQNFSSLKNKPCQIDLGYPDKGNKYDDLIAGWVNYWNDVLKPDVPLDPNLIKALIASESRFEPTILANKKDSNSARGLTQITNETRALLGGYHGDLTDHLITLTIEELNNPNENVCAGVRWLFEKRRLASIHLKKTASWVEAIWEYKGVKRSKTIKESENIKDIFNRFYQELQKCGKD